MNFAFNRIFQDCIYPPLHSPTINLEEEILCLIYQQNFGIGFGKAISYNKLQPRKTK